MEIGKIGMVGHREDSRREVLQRLVSAEVGPGGRTDPRGAHEAAFYPFEYGGVCGHGHTMVQNRNIVNSRNRTGLKKIIE
jgi:hypothetical protein